MVDYGRPATFKCNYKGNPVKQVYWLKNGEPLGHTEATLRINSVKKDDRGMYQCFVRNDQESAQVGKQLLFHLLNAQYDDTTSDVSSPARRQAKNISFFFLGPGDW